MLKHWRAGAAAHAQETSPAVDDEEIADDARRLVDDLEAMGPTFVKLGQLLSTRADLLPRAYLEALSRLQEHVQPIPFQDVERIVTAAVGTKLSKAFTSFDREPAASASLGQVHRATLRDGRAVAVKVQRPGVGEQVAQDMEVIEELATFVDRHTEVGRTFVFGAMVEEFRRSLMAELDYRLEAANLRELGANLAGYDRIVVPQPITSYSTDNVLTMEYVEGRSLRSLSPVARAEIDGEVLADQLFACYLDQVLVHGFFHADPHPGNVLLTTSTSGETCLALIDLGMVARIAPRQQDLLIRLLIGLGRGEVTEVAEVMAELGQPRETWDPQRFEREIAVLIEQHRGTDIAGMQSGRVLGEVAHRAMECGLQPPAELTMLGKALLSLDEIVRILDPRLDPNATIQDHVADIMRSKLLQSASPANLMSAAMDVKEFLERLPRRVNKVMDALAQGELTLNVQGIDEKELMRGIQKLANRLTMGLVIAALIVGAAMLMRIDTKSKLFGYPSLAIVCFLVAALAGVCLVANSVLHDLPQRRRRRR
jgi:ubiquinone biosynthesis protein